MRLVRVYFVRTQRKGGLPSELGRISGSQERLIEACGEPQLEWHGIPLGAAQHFCKIREIRFESQTGKGNSVSYVPKVGLISTRTKSNSQSC